MDKHRPSVAQLLQIDADYRELAERGALPVIAPPPFVRAHAVRLPVLHAERDGLQFTVSFSSAARAGELGSTKDEVLIAYGQGPCAVVTERRGTLAGLRVVRGRETECRQHHARALAAVRRGESGRISAH